MEHLRPITEQQKRTNILLAELDRSTIPHNINALQQIQLMFQEPYHFLNLVDD